MSIYSAVPEEFVQHAQETNQPYYDHARQQKRVHCSTESCCSIKYSFHSTKESNLSFLTSNPSLYNLQSVSRVLLSHIGVYQLVQFLEGAMSVSLQQCLGANVLRLPLLCCYSRCRLQKTKITGMSARFMKHVHATRALLRPHPLLMGKTSVYALQKLSCTSGQ